MGGVKAAAIIAAALAVLGCNSCSSTPEAKDPVEVPGADPSATATATGDPAVQQRATGGCVIGGCSGELCNPPEMPEMATICQHKPEWDCYREAQCGRNEQNQCEWVLSPELEKCLKVHGGRNGADVQ